MQCKIHSRIKASGELTLAISLITSNVFLDTSFVFLVSFIFLRSFGGGGGWGEGRALRNSLFLLTVFLRFSFFHSFLIRLRFWFPFANIFENKNLRELLRVVQ